MLAELLPILLAVFLILPVVLLSSAVLLNRYVRRRLIGRYVREELGGRLSATYFLTRSEYDVVYFTAAGERRKAKCFISHRGEVNWTNDASF